LSRRAKAEAALAGLQAALGSSVLVCGLAAAQARALVERGALDPAALAVVCAAYGLHDG
jgi:hypothetical protein